VLEVDDYGHYGFVTPDRLDGATLHQGAALLADKNAAGEIATLILRNVTNDFNGFGVVTSVTEVDKPGTMILSSVYIYDIAGTPGVLQMNDAIWFLKTGPSMFIMKDKTIEAITALTRIDSAVTAVNPLAVKTSDGKTYKVSAHLTAYKLMNGVYTATNADDALSCKTVHAYYDKPETEGGCVRVIVGD